MAKPPLSVMMASHARLEAALGLVIGLTRFQHVGSIMNVTFAIDGDFVAGRRPRRLR